MKKVPLNYAMIDLLKFTAAVMVICVHSGPISNHQGFNFFVQNVLCRLAVPFFFVSTAYFIRKKSRQEPSYFQKKITGLLKNYLFWSMIFLPVGLDWLHQNLTISPQLYPLALLFGLGYSGTYYHLWYIPAVILALVLVNKLLKHFSYRYVFMTAGALYLVGSLETYYSLLGNGWPKQLFDGFIQVFFTTRNGLFFGLLFVVLGFYIYDRQEQLLRLKRWFAPALLAASLLLLGEGWLVSGLTRLDCNFLLSLIPFTLVLFLWALTTKLALPFETAGIRQLSQYYYFIHPICVVILFELGNAFRLNFLGKGLGSFLLVCLFSHLLSKGLLQLKKGSLSKKAWLAAFMVGLLLTDFVGAFLFTFERAVVPIQFEVTPCLMIGNLILAATFINWLTTRKRVDLPHWPLAEVS